MKLSRRDFFAGVAIGGLGAEGVRQTAEKVYELHQNDPKRKATIFQIAETFELEEKQIENLVNLVEETRASVLVEKPDCIIKFFFDGEKMEPHG